MAVLPDEPDCPPSAVSSTRRAAAGRRPALLERFPRPFWWRPDPDSEWADDWPVLRVGAEARYPCLASDFRLWAEACEQRFRRLDHEAQVRQHQFWRQQVTLLLGGLVATALGAYQAARGGGNLSVALAQALVTGLLTALTAYARARRAQQAYLTARLKAERIKSEFFLFLARAGAYAETDPEDRLRQQVEQIADAEEVG